MAYRQTWINREDRAHCVYATLIMQDDAGVRPDVRQEFKFLKGRDYQAPAEITNTFLRDRFQAFRDQVLADQADAPQRRLREARDRLRANRQAAANALDEVVTAGGSPNE